MLGMIDLADPDGRVARDRSPRAFAPRFAMSPAERLMIAPDCGMKYLSRAIAFGKLRAMVAGAAIVRAELA